MESHRALLERTLESFRASMGTAVEPFRVSIDTALAGIRADMVSHREGVDTSLYPEVDCSSTVKRLRRAPSVRVPGLATHPPASGAIPTSVPASLLIASWPTRPGRPSPCPSFPTIGKRF